MIGGVIKYFRFDYEFVLWGISWANLIMMLATIPTYKDTETKEDKEVDIEQPADLLDFIKL